MSDITLFTGGIGASKTLNAVAELFTDPRLNSRPLFVYGVKQFDCERFEKETGSQAQYLTEAEVKEWHLYVPTNSVIFIDEVQKLWRQRKVGSSVPIGCQEMEEARHSGIDFVMTCQFPTQLDIHVRKLVTRHVHLVSKPSFVGRKRSTWLEWGAIQSNTDDYHAKQEALVNKVVGLRKEFFGTYKSADTHHVSARIPSKVWFVFGLIAFIGYMLYYVVTSLLPSDAVESVKESATGLKETITGGVSGPNTGASFDAIDPAGVVDRGVLRSSYSYVAAVTPVVPDKPNTAPIYASLHEAVVMPRMMCLERLSGEGVACRCYTQQATIAKVSERQCKYHVQFGYDFDYTYLEGEDDTQGEGGLSEPHRQYEPQPKKHFSGNNLRGLKSEPTPSRWTLW